MEINFKLRLLGLGNAQTVEKLSEKQAIELGGDMLGEFLVFFFASLVLISEYQRSSRKEAAKEDKLKQEKLKISNRFKELETRGEVQELQIKEMQEQLYTYLNNKELKLTKQFQSYFRIF
uniref:OPA3-like protein n=2 Tax=Arion vulgaris TaxID=1028688 RepID=A0A0B6ZEG4_9EUPU